MLYSVELANRGLLSVLRVQNYNVYFNSPNFSQFFSNIFLKNLFLRFVMQFWIESWIEYRIEFGDNTLKAQKDFPCLSTGK